MTGKRKITALLVSVMLLSGCASFDDVIIGMIGDTVNTAITGDPGQDGLYGDQDSAARADDPRNCSALSRELAATRSSLALTRLREARTPPNQPFEFSDANRKSLVRESDLESTMRAKRC